jgi:hypothetical protein
VAGRQGAGTSLSSGAILLRQGRLRAAALGLCVWWGLILLQVLLAGRRWIEPAALVLTLGAASVLLSRRGPIRPARLRALEFAIFALIVAVLAARRELSDGLDPPRTPCREGDDRPEGELLQVLCCVLGPDHNRLKKLRSVM